MIARISDSLSILCTVHVGHDGTGRFRCFVLSSFFTREGIGAENGDSVGTTGMAGSGDGNGRTEGGPESVPTSQFLASQGPEVVRAWQH